MQDHFAATCPVKCRVEPIIRKPSHLARVSRSGLGRGHPSAPSSICHPLLITGLCYSLVLIILHLSNTAMSEVQHLVQEVDSGVSDNFINVDFAKARLLIELEA